jgi:hypothetical protein
MSTELAIPLRVLLPHRTFVPLPGNLGIRNPSSPRGRRLASTNFIFRTISAICNSADYSPIKRSADRSCNFYYIIDKVQEGGLFRPLE